MEIAVPSAKRAANLKDCNHLIRLDLGECHAEKAGQIVGAGRIPFFEGRGSLESHDAPFV
jgi:hypothetical protein